MERLSPEERAIAERNRDRTLTIVVSLASLSFIVPHIVEDFEHGIAARVGLSTGTLAFLLGGFLALQSLGLVLLGQGRRGGYLVTLVVAAVWVAGALVEHGSALLAAGRHPETSIPWLLGLLVTQAACLALAWRGWRSLP